MNDPDAVKRTARLRRATVLAVGAVSTAAVLGAAWWHWRAPSAADGADPAVIAQGREVYARYCASCHGERLEGQPDWQTRRADGRMPAPPHDATGHTWHHPSGVLFTIVKNGVQAYAPPGYQSDMPAFHGVLTDAQIRAVLAYIASNWPEAIRARQAEIERASRQRQ